MPFGCMSTNPFGLQNRIIRKYTTHIKKKKNTQDTIACSSSMCTVPINTYRTTNHSIRYCCVFLGKHISPKAEGPHEWKNVSVRVCRKCTVAIAHVSSSIPICSGEFWIQIWRTKMYK